MEEHIDLLNGKEEVLRDGLGRELQVWLQESCLVRKINRALQLLWGAHCAMQRCLRQSQLCLRLLRPRMLSYLKYVRSRFFHYYPNRKGARPYPCIRLTTGPDP